jgi:hypothetical protein
LSEELIYEEVPTMSAREIEVALRGNDVDRACDAVLSAALYFGDWRDAQRVCLKSLGHSSDVVKRSAIIGLGHIVRIHGSIDIDVVNSEIQKFSENDFLSGYIENLQSDINIFYHRPRAEEDKPN